MASKLVIYTKEDCHLCQQAKEKLKGLQKEFDFVMEEVDITKDGELYWKYKEAIPVVEIGNEVILKAPFGEFRLRRALEQGKVPRKRNPFGGLTHLK